MARDTRFQKFTSPAGDGSPEGTPDSEVYARVSTGSVKDADGNDTPDRVRTLSGEQAVSKGDVVVEVPDRPDTYDVVPADVWGDLGWTGESNSPARKSTASKSTASSRKGR